jgi:hypothetical protein
MADPAPLASHRDEASALPDSDEATHFYRAPAERTRARQLDEREHLANVVGPEIDDVRLALGQRRASAPPSANRACRVARQDQNGLSRPSRAALNR